MHGVSVNFLAADDWSEGSQSHLLLRAEGAPIDRLACEKGTDDLLGAKSSLLNITN